MTDTKPDPVLRLARVLRERTDECGGYTQLAEAIRVVWGTKKPPVDRRKLRRIVYQDDSVTFSITEIRALDKYLTPFGEGLADRALLVRRSLLSSLSAKDRAKLLLGAYPRKDERIDVSRWDMRAVSILQAELGHLHPGTKSKIDDMLLREELATDPEAREQFERYLEDKELGLCTVGASRSNPASEGALCTMFSVEPFVEPAKGELPFRFIWSEKPDKTLPSAFAYGADDIQARDAGLAGRVRDDKAWALLAQGELYETPRTKEDEGEEWKDYGIVAAQRRPGGRAWLVVAGLSGPATFASALAVIEQRTGTMPEAPNKASPSKIIWSLVEATVVRDESVPGDSRVVKRADVLLTCTWDPEEQAAAE